MEDREAYLARKRLAAAKQRKKKKALGIKDVRKRVPKTPEQLAQQREYAARRRAEAKAAGIQLPSDTWAKRNPERQLERTRKWRSANPEKHREHVKAYRERHPERYAKGAREAVQRQRNTAWGQITTNTFRIMRHGLRNGAAPGRYNFHLGYSWGELKAHLEAQFVAGMTWENWGPVWEIDHIVPLSATKYESLDDPLFRQAWALPNIRPLLKAENRMKASRLLNY